MDLLAFTGHKSLFGPTGTGGLYVREGVSLTPLLRGGTGSNSPHEIQPDFLPDALESGTANAAGLAGLAAGVQFVSNIGAEIVAAHERKLVSHFIQSASQIEKLSLYGPPGAGARCGIVSFNVAGALPSEVCLILDERFSIMARPGLHCAPSAHRTLGTFPTGTVRFSFGWFNTMEQVDESLRALRRITAMVE